MKYKIEELHFSKSFAFEVLCACDGWCSLLRFGQLAESFGMKVSPFSPSMWAQWMLLLMLVVGPQGLLNSNIGAAAFCCFDS